MLKLVVTVFLLIVSTCSGQRRNLKRWQSLSQPASRGEAFPEQWLDQIRDHFDATNTARWPQRYWENLEEYRGEGLAFLHIGGEAEAPDRAWTITSISRWWPTPWRPRDPAVMWP